MEKKVDWYGALFSTAIYLAVINAIVFIIIRVLEGESYGLDFHIILSIFFTISGVIRGVIIPYEGFNETEELDEEYYFKPPKIVGYVWTALIVIMLVYVFFIL